MLDSFSELTPDLEWMLQSGQASREMLVEALMQEYGDRVARLALAWLGDRPAAGTAWLETFAAALAAVYQYKGQGGVDAWFFPICIEACQRVERRLRRQKAAASRQKGAGEEPAASSSVAAGSSNAAVPAELAAALEGYLFPEPPGDLERLVWPAYDALGPQERAAVLLQSVLGWPPELIERALHKNSRAVAGLLELAQRRLAEPLWSQGWAETDVEPALAGALQARWPEIHLPDALPETLAPAVEQAAAARRGQHRSLNRLKELIWIAAAATVIIVAVWGYNQLNPEPPAGEALEASALKVASENQARHTALYTVRPGDTLAALTGRLGISEDALHDQNFNPIQGELQPGQQVWVSLDEIKTAPAKAAESDPPAAPRVGLLGMGSSSDEIRLRLAQSEVLWSTLWVDAQIVTYGPANYIGPARQERVQAWVRLPGQSLELSGPQAGAPENVLLVTGGHAYATYRTESTLLDPAWLGAAPQPLAGSPLHDLVFPGQAAGFRADGQFKPVENARLAGRQALAVDYLDPQGLRLSRLWLDARTGVVLRWQRYGGGDFSTLVEEITMAQVDFDEKLFEAVFDPTFPWVGGFAVGREPTLQPLQTAPPETPPAGLLASRQPLRTNDAPPAGYDPARAQLIFQLSRSLDGSLPLTQTADVPAEVFADGYFLGELEHFGLPWTLICTRSPDGQRLAFASGASQTGDEAGGLGWVNLSDLAHVYQPAPGFRASELAFSPDGRRLALFAYSQSGQPSGVYLLNLGASQMELLLPLENARSLVWSPDGQSLALIGSGADQTEQMLVVRASSGQILFSSLVGKNARQSNADWPTNDWGVEFPRAQMGGMEACEFPPPAVQP